MQIEALDGVKERILVKSSEKVEILMATFASCSVDPRVVDRFRLDPFPGFERELLH